MTTLNETFTQQGADRTKRSPSREQTPSTGDYRRAYRGRTETTNFGAENSAAKFFQEATLKGENVKGGGNKRRTRAYRSRET